MSYQLKISRLPGSLFVCVQRDGDGAFIPFDLGNRDCAQFLADWIAGVSVLRPNGEAYAYSAANRLALGL